MGYAPRFEPRFSPRLASRFSGVSGVVGGRSPFEPINGLGDLSNGLYADFTKGSLVPERGPTFSLTRASASTTVDFEGLVRPILSGEARFRGLRRVENLLSKSDAIVDGVGWTANGTTVTAGISDPLGGTTAYTLTGASAGTKEIYNNPAGTTVVGRSYRSSMFIRRRTGTGTVFFTSVNGGGEPQADFSSQLTSSWQRFANTAAAATTTSGYLVLRLGTNGDAVDIWHPQLEDVTGQAITAPSEYVSKGVLSAPYHGAGVDGVKNFATANGNTVASNVVTEATGSSLTLTGRVGIDPYGAATNIALHNRDQTNAAWVKGATMTAAKDQTGADGVANGASSLTGGAVSSTNTSLQTVTLASSSRSQETWIKRLVGTGTVEMTTDNGTTWVNITSSITSGWTKVRIPARTVTNPVFGFRITTDLDKIAVDYVQNTSVVDAPSVATTTAAVTVNADVITAAGAGVINQTEGGLWVEAVGPVVVDRRIFMIDDGTLNEFVSGLYVGGSFAARGDIVDGGASQMANVDGTFTAGTTGKGAARYKLNDSNFAFGGTALTADTSCTMPAPTTFRVGGSPTAGQEANTTIRKAAYTPVGPSDASLATATAP